MSRLNLYVIYHGSIRVPSNEVLIPISAERRDGDAIPDRTDYSELRAHYWVWKNAELSDYVGFFHFRRYFDFFGTGSLPYRILPDPAPEEYTEARILPVIDGYDIVAPIPEYTGLNVWEKYAFPAFEDVGDLVAARQILSEMHPDCLSALDAYFAGKREYFCNMFVMKKELFCLYCEWLFPMLDEFRRRVPDAQPRTEGYLAERLFGVFLTVQREKGARILEVPRTLYSSYGDDRHHTGRRKILNFLLPPGSIRRGLVLRTVSIGGIRRRLRKAGL